MSSINSCSSCQSGNLATQYAQQLSDKLQDRLRGHESNPSTRANPPTEAGGSTVNSMGKNIGTLINTSA